MFSDEFFVLAAVRPFHVLQLHAVECCGTRTSTSVDSELTLTSVTDLAHSVNVLVTVRRDIVLREQRQLHSRWIVLKTKTCTT